MGNEISGARFIINNGIVLNRINLLRHTFTDLRSVQLVSENAGVKPHEFLDCINFLSEEGYIELRQIGSKKAARLADADYTTLEAMLTPKGIRLASGKMTDELVGKV